MPERTSPLPGILLALAAFALFSTHDIAVKMLGGGYSVFQIIFFSVLLTFPLVVFMLLRDSEASTLIPRHPWWSVLRTVAAVNTGFCAFYAFSVLPLAQVYAMIFASPLLITLLAIPILGEKVGIHRGGACVVGLLGVLVVLQPGSQEGLDLGLGHAAALLAAFTGALASVIVRKIGRDERAAVLMLYPMMANFAVMGLLLPFVYKPMPLGDLGLWAMMAGLAFLAGLALIQAYRRADAVLVAPMQYSQIVWAALYGWLFFGETIDAGTALGAGIIIASGLYIVFREGRGRSRHTPVLRTRTRPETGTTFRIGRMLSEEARAVSTAYR
ncbi:S-adenosylmethionine uptake transporter [Jannaschia faecimaris]|uniref:S-adenosylmethionine uptake transporter n=1 Tax=Jannaschia faecimaris TaxID=1244108 RepID=A0A1H3JK48_9RHOB|nr:DMT family transporter [Jannaschia faecimaris]SDY40360.1 S-adenosylmethionine uptake transporter [Jannaschia faecimaris]